MNKETEKKLVKLLIEDLKSYLEKDNYNLILSKII